MTMTNHDLQTETFDHHQHARPLAIRFLAALEMTLGWVRWDSAAGVILVRCYPVIPSASDLCPVGRNPVFFGCMHSLLSKISHYFRHDKIIMIRYKLDGRALPTPPQCHFERSEKSFL